ncbi:MAG: succinate dehydrogenase cytochrome b subunit [Acidobacteria bacterium]|nr:succinate dehydrogenase cytochrome b subunit [Acidobacteriota bacterium]
MASRGGFLSTSVGTKLLIGVTGFLLFLYLLIHIGGNALIFFGPAVFNNYAYVMEQKNPLLPLIELALLAVFLIHAFKTVRMFLANQSARPVPYAMKKPAGTPSRKTLASSTMIVSGLWLLVFLIIHVKAFRFGPEYDWPAGGRDLYRQEMENLSNPLMVLFYILSMTVVGSHLFHGIASAVQSLGLDHPKWTPRLLFAGKVFAVIIAVGFMIIAAWVYLNQPGAGRVRV